MYWPTVLFRRAMYTSNSYRNVSLITYPRVEDYQLPLVCLQGRFHGSRWYTLWWNPPSDLPMQGVTPHVSEPNRNMAWTNALKLRPGICTPDPSFPITLDIHAHFFLYLFSFITTIFQSLYVATMMCPRYLNTVTFDRGRFLVLPPIDTFRN